MITDAILNVLELVVKAMLTPLLVLVPAAPSWVSQGVGYVGQVLGFLNGFESWVPVTLGLTVAGIIAATWVVSVTIQLARVIVSYLTLGGGAT